MSTPSEELIEARELLAAAYEAARRRHGATMIREGSTVVANDEFALTALTSALSLRDEARSLALEKAASVADRWFDEGNDVGEVIAEQIRALGKDES